MIDINKLFSTDKKDAIAFYNEEHDLTPEQRSELHRFFEGTYKTTLVAKSFIGIAAGLTMVWLARRKRKISPLYAMVGGIGVSAFVFSYMTPTIYQNKIQDLERRFGKDSKEYKVVQVTPEGAEYSYYWSQYFSNSILDKTIRLKDPTKTLTSNDINNVEFVDSSVPFGHRSTEDHLIDHKSPAENQGSSWERLRESQTQEKK
ncbi:hypothetical protein C6P40_003788 [Pichia californica]|uniref:Uncharacterized protein n=1 Tax=Pichia californica TaxID=460514 RepID=A0A9P7BD69_9ASCO|nr:hypothetical protein C6P40_003788 [[Candida] californica]